MINRREFVQTSLATAAYLASPGVPAATTDATALTLQQASAALRRRSLSPVDLTRACLDRIATLDPRLNSFITVVPERAMAEARERERELARGQRRGPLHGIPLALKDNIDTAGIRTTAAAKGFAERIPAGRCRGGPAPAGVGRHPARQAQHGRVRLRRDVHQRAFRRRAESLERGPRRPAARRAALPPPSPPASATARSARTPAARSASPPPGAASPD